MLSCGVTLAAWHNQFITLVMIRTYESYVNLQCEHRKWRGGGALPSCLLLLLFDQLLKNILSSSVKRLFRFFTLISFDFDSTKEIRDANMLPFRNNPFAFSVWVHLSDVSHTNRSADTLSFDINYCTSNFLLVFFHIKTLFATAWLKHF